MDIEIASDLAQVTLSVTHCHLSRWGWDITDGPEGHLLFLSKSPPFLHPITIYTLTPEKQDLCNRQSLLEWHIHINVSRSPAPWLPLVAAHSVGWWRNSRYRFLESSCPALACLCSVPSPPFLLIPEKSAFQFPFLAPFLGVVVVVTGVGVLLYSFALRELRVLLPLLLFWCLW